MVTKDAWYLKRWLFPFYGFIFFTLAFPHGNLWPLAWICLVPYFLFIDGEKNWCKLIFLPSVAYAIPMFYCYFGFFYFSHNDYSIFAVFMMFLLMPVTLLLKLIIVKSRGLPRAVSDIFLVLGLSLMWVTYEIFRSTAPLINVSAGALLGYSQCFNLPVLQWARIFGVYGVSFLVVAVNSAFFLLLRPVEQGEKRLRRVPLIILGIALCITLVGSVTLLFGPPSKGEVRVGLIQPNTPLRRMRTKQEKQEVIDRLVRLGREAAEEQPDVIIYPERAFPGNMNHPSVYSYVEQMKELAKETETPLIVGSRYDVSHRERYNSAYFINAEGRTIGRYDKMILFPIGEYIPLAAWLEKWINLVQAHKLFPDILGQGDEDHFSAEEYFNIRFLTAGNEPTTFQLDNKYTFAVPICVEDVLPHVCRAFANQGAQFLAVITNDVWFRKTSILTTHLLFSVMRAVENGVSVVRAANTGISAIILPNGRVMKTVKNDKGYEKMVEGYIVDTIPVTDGKTFYNQFGYLFQHMCVVLAIFSIILAASFPKRD